ncbi:hypothetical protein D3C80_1639210 [compost metagenome]
MPHALVVEFKAGHFGISGVHKAFIRLFLCKAVCAFHRRSRILGVWRSDGRLAAIGGWSGGRLSEGAKGRRAEKRGG